MNQHATARPFDLDRAEAPCEQHHGDLRKGTYLRRRAAYQAQAETPGQRQAGAPVTHGDQRQAR